MPITYLLAIIAFPAVAIYWFIRMKDQKKSIFLLGALCLIAAGPFVFSLGGFFATFSSNQCYSQSISRVSNMGLQVARSKDDSAIAQFAELVKHLPLRGYETNCDEIDARLNAFEKSHSSQTKK